MKNAIELRNIKIILDFVATQLYNDCSDKQGGDKMSPIQKGFKLTDNPKDTMFRVRLDKETVKKLDYLAEELKKSKSEIVRNGIEEQYKKIKE